MRIIPFVSSLLSFLLIDSPRYCTCFKPLQATATSTTSVLFRQSDHTARLSISTTAISTELAAMSSSSSTDGNGRLLVSIIDQIGEGDDSQIRLVLASQSPRRREILDMMGLSSRYTARPSPLDETMMQQKLIAEKLTPIEYTKRLAEAKAYALADLEKHSNTLYLGSDTIVEIDDVILEKPKNKDEAISMLQKLSGQEHYVQTGVALYYCGRDTTTTGTTTSPPPPKLVSSFTETAKVTFDNLSNDDIIAYVNTEEPMDKAGSYGIQGIGGQLVSKLDGDFFTVMGLPMNKLSIALVDVIKNKL